MRSQPIIVEASLVMMSKRTEYIPINFVFDNSVLLFMRSLRVRPTWASVFGVNLAEDGYYFHT